MKNVLLVFILLNIIFLSSELDDSDIIILEEDSDKSLIIDSIDPSTTFFVTGFIDTSKKYILISTNFPNNSHKNSPYLFITKKESFNSEKDQYDYSSIQESTFGTKLALPQKYFSEEEVEGFFLEIKCLDGCNEVHLDFQYVDEIILNIGEKFSFYAKDESIDDFSITVIDKQISTPAQGNDVFIINGGDKNQLSMDIDKNKAIEELPNVFAYVKETLSEKTEVKIKVAKNVRFTFISQKIDIAIQNHKNLIYIDEFNQYYMLYGGRDEYLQIEDFQDETLSYDNEISVVSKKDLVLYFNNKNGANYHIDYQYNEDKIFKAITHQYNRDLIDNIFFKLTKDKRALIHISLHKIYFNFKLAEPLLEDVTYTYNLKGVGPGFPNQNINIHSHSHYFENDENYMDIQGMNVGISIISGDVKVYKTLWKTYPFYYYTEEDLDEDIENEDYDTDFQTIFPVNDYFDFTFSSPKDNYPGSNFQNIIIVVCNENEEENNEFGCIYSITYKSIQEPKKLFDESKIVKFLNSYKEFNSLKNEDKYEIFLHSNKKLVVDLIIYSGDAYIVPSYDPDGCSFEEHNLGSNEKRILSCKNEISDYMKYSFKVAAGNGGAVYLLFIKEKNIGDMVDVWPVQVNAMESIKESSRILTLNKFEVNTSAKMKYSNYLTFFNSINCKLIIKNLLNEKEYSTEGVDLVADIINIDKEKNNNNVLYIIKKKESTHSNEDNCLYYISSFCTDNFNSYLTLPEGKPFRFKLNKNINIVRTIFPFASTSSYPKVYLTVTLSNILPIKIKIKIGYSFIQEYIIFQSKDILILDGIKHGVRADTICKILIVAELDDYKTNDEVIIDFNIKTNLQIPYSIKSEEYFSDAVIKNKAQYYLSLVNKNSYGEVLVNFKHGRSGIIYGRLVNPKEEKEQGGWKNRILLPDENTKYLLKFDSYYQKLTITEKDTLECENYCYLIFAVTANNDYQDWEEWDDDNLSSYSLYFKYQNMNESSINYVNLRSDEFIKSSITNKQDDYYKFNIPVDSDIILIYFKSDYCLLTLAFDTNDFENEEKTKKYLSNGINNYIKLNKEEILKYYSSEKNISSTKNLIFYAKVSRRFTDQSIDIDKLDMKYILKINSPIKLMKDIITADIGSPIYCANSIETEYCDYLINLDSYDCMSDIELVGVSLGHDKLFIYCNLIDNIQFSKNITQGKLPDWPNKEIFMFPNDLHEAGNFLKITSAELFAKLVQTDNILINPRLLIRVYSDGNSPMELVSTLFNYQNQIAPFPKEYQLISAGIYDSLQIIMPSDYSYTAHFITFSGKGLLTLNEAKNYTLYGDYYSLILGSQPSEQEIYDLLGIQDSLDVDYDSNFRCFLWFSKNDYSENMEKLSEGSGNTILYRNKDVPLGYFVRISNETKDLPFNIRFIVLESSKQYLDSFETNVTETFLIKGYLITEEELIKIQIDKNEMPEKEYIGIYDYSLRQGNIIIESSEIQQFRNKSGENIPIYAYFTIEKSPLNRREYVNIEGAVSVYFPDDIKRSTPSNTFISNYFKANNTKTEKHIYKLDGLSSSDEEYRKMKIEFSTINKNVSVKIVKDPNTNKEEKTYFNLYKSANREDIGKDVIIVRDHLSEVYLVIECPPTPYEVEYTFKYMVTVKELFDYQYENVVNYTKLSEGNSKVSLSINKVNLNPEGKIVNCNYYIRVFEKNEKLGDLNSSVTFRREKPYIVYKIDSQDQILQDNKKSFSVTINVELFNQYYIDILAEILQNNEFVAYKRFYPSIKLSEENDNSDRFFENRTVYIIIAVCFLFLIFISCLIAFAFIYKKKNKLLEKRVEDISFKLSQTMNKENLLEGEETINALD